ncbi:MAG: oligosaccharide flippase family protein [Phycisphaerales bacterium]|nr:oligosaccharide flippase family protein [Phycisphaerales bacterium]
MGIVFRQSIKSSIIILLGAILGLVFTIWQTKVMIKIEIGVSKNIIYQTVVLQNFFLLGGPSILLTFIHRYSKNEAKRWVLFSFLLLLPLICTLLFSIPYFFFRQYVLSKYQPIDRTYYDDFYIWIPIFTLIWSYMTLFEFYLIGIMKSALATFMKEVVLKFANLGILACFAFQIINFKEFFISSVLIYLLPLGLLFYFTHQDKKIKLSFDWKIFSKLETKGIVYFAWYHMLIGVSLNLVAYIDQLMLAPLSHEGSSVLAVYSIAIFLVSFVSIPYRAMLNATIPKLNEAFIEKNNSHLAHLFNRANLNILVATAFVGTLIVSNIHNVVAILPKGYESLKPLFLILFLGRLIDVSTGLNQELISITPHYKFTFWAALVYIVIALVGNRIFIPIYGIYGAAWVAAFSLAIYNIVKAIYLKQKFGLYPFQKRGLWVFPIIALAYSVSCLIPQLSNPIIDGLIRTPIVAIVMILLLFWLKPSEDLKEYWLTVKNKKRLF